jgi:hypothetical protein
MSPDISLKAEHIREQLVADLIINHNSPGVAAALSTSDKSLLSQLVYLLQTKVIQHPPGVLEQLKALGEALRE